MKYTRFDYYGQELEIKSSQYFLIKWYETQFPAGIGMWIKCDVTKSVITMFPV